MRKMIQLTHYDSTGRASNAFDVDPSHIIAIEAANPRGALLTMTRGTVHVAQTREQVKQLRDREVTTGGENDNA